MAIALWVFLICRDDGAVSNQANETADYLEGFLRTYMLPSKLGGRRPRFIASGSIRSDLHERDPIKRAPFRRRARVMLMEYGLWLHLLFVAVCAFGILQALGPRYRRFEADSRIILALTVFAWPPLDWFKHVCSCLIPLWYMIAPPNKPPEAWKPTKGKPVRYPTRTGPERTRFGNPFDFIEHAIALYALLAMAVSFWL